jgi:putative endonuclease
VSRKKGNIGEDIAVEYLGNLKLVPVARNYYSRYGEIDIIFEDGKFIVFAEVKARKTGSMVQAEECITAKKQQKIINTAYKYLESNGVTKQPRFDVITIKFGNGGEQTTINHIKNAFDSTDMFD